MPDLSNGPTEDELQALRDRGNELRERKAVADAELSQSEVARARQYEAEQLIVENARLEAAAAGAERRAAIVASTEGDATIKNLEDANRRELEAALAALEATPGVPVDTNKVLDTEPEPVVIEPKEGEVGFVPPETETSSDSVQVPPPPGQPLVEQGDDRPLSDPTDDGDKTDTENGDGQTEAPGVSEIFGGQFATDNNEQDGGTD